MSIHRMALLTLGIVGLSLALSNSTSAAGAAAPAAGAAAPPPPPYRAPYLPAHDADLLQEVPSLKDPAVVNIRKLRAQLDADPRSLPNAIGLADAYIDFSRQVGDAHFAGYAEAVLAPWTSLAAPPADALLSQAIILQYRHQFSEARALLQQTLRLAPRRTQAWLTLATLDMVQGDYPAAAKDCAQVLNNGGLELGLACQGNLRGYTGEARKALSLLQQVESSDANAPAAYKAWIYGLSAETAERLGDWPLAEARYRAALQVLPQDNFLLVAYADFLLDRGRFREVLPLLADHTQSDTAFLRIALAQDALHAPDAARYTWAMAARFEALTLRGSEYFGREEARFALRLQHDPRSSLAMATRNWQVQRAPWDARVLLEAALAARQPGAAADVVAFVKATHLEDPVVVPLVQEISALATAPRAAAGGMGKP